MDVRGAPEFQIAAAAKLRVPLYVQTTFTLLYTVAYTFLKLFVTSLNWLPIVISSFFLLGQASLIACVRVPRRHSFARLQVLNTVVMCVFTIGAALVNPGSQEQIKASGYWVDALGLAPVCSCKPEGWCGDKASLFTTIVTANVMVFNNVFIFRLRYGIISSALNVSLYFAILRWLGWWDRNDVLLVAMMCTMSFAIKQIIEMHEHKLFCELHKQRQQTVQEKVLRCAAEFEREQLKGGNIHLELHTSENDECNTQSAVSAPAVVQQPGQIASVNQLVCSGSSCLPCAAEVWKEGHSVPTPVQEVAPDDRVLCLDEWTGSIIYLPITEVHITDAHQTSWVMVTLEDGSMQQMTSDHPVCPHAHGQPCPWSRACDLKPAYHTIPVLKLMHVPVKAIKHLEVDTTSTQAGMNSKKVSLSVNDNRRYTVLACCGPEQEGQCCMAVGAVAPLGAKEVFSHNTFLHVVTEDFGVLRRCMSEPALHTTNMPPSNTGTNNVSSSGGATSTTESSGDTASILIWDQDVCKASFVAALRSKNLPSAGSDLHESGNCRPCLFHTRQNKQWASCWKGRLCSHCHVTAGHMRRLPRNLRSRYE